jgi:hypothetical protein
VALEVHGLRFAIGGDWPEVEEEVGRDFAWFAEPGSGAGTNGSGIQIRIERRPPAYEDFAGLEPAFVTPRNVVYSAAGVTVIDYFGRALSVLDRAGGRLVVQGEDPHLVHEATYHFLLSRVGEHLDAIGLPRLHALGLSSRSGAVAILLPSGGGKSTLALRALEDDSGVRLLSEDSPLIDRTGTIHPFPLRMGVNPHQADLLPPGNVRRLERMEFDPKLLLDLDAYRDRIEPEPRPLRHLVIGQRWLGGVAILEEMPRRVAVGPLLREVVVGVGLYQGMEFVLQHKLTDVARQARPALTRARRCVAGLRRARVWRLRLGRDAEHNWDALRRLLD